MRAPQGHEGGPLHRRRDHAGLCAQEGGPAQWHGDRPTSSGIPCHPTCNERRGGTGWGSHSHRLPHSPRCPSRVQEGGGHRGGGASQSPRRASRRCWDHVRPSCEEGPPSHMGAMLPPLDPTRPPLMWRLRVQEGEGILFPRPPPLRRGIGRGREALHGGGPHTKGVSRYNRSWLDST